MPGRSERVAHVVQAVERRRQVITGAGEARRRRDLEPDPIGDAGVGGSLAGDLDRLVVVVRPGEPRVGVLLGEQDGGCAEPAADVGDRGAGPQLVGHAVQRRDPGRDQVGGVAGPEELLAAGEHALVVLVPAHPGTAAERLGDARLGLQRAEREHERPGNIHGAVRVGQRERLLLGHRVGLRGGIVLHVPASRLPAQPLGDVPRAGPGPLGELFGARRTRRQRPVQAEPVPDNHVPGREGGPQVGDEPAEKLLQLVHVNSHDEPPVLGVRLPAAGRRSDRDGLASRRLRVLDGGAGYAAPLSP